MIKFFRKIRKNLLNEGKTTKYFKYAIGEIVLVVIGILIALQINNWNQEYQERNAEKKVIADLKASLINTESQLGDLILIYKSNLERMNYVVDQLNSRRPLDDELKMSFHHIESYPEPLFEIGVYDNFKINSLQLIKNDRLKTAIIQFYEAQLPSIGHKLSNNMESVVITSLMPLNVQNFSYGDNAMMTPNDYERLLNNQQYFNAISYMSAIKEFALSEIQRVLETVKFLIDDVVTYQNQIE
ncbi:DUF6090 family protein [Nonlabens marinus]|uniref:Uncharacterized protein n=1 Tax=Nonlabens marinus S1-08 TaxID=1454201 RepID=W8VXZ2_9FLAO|nr:DUF6090 family protein [Nonlabens marinus]BAO56772.1 hypothetical protein NMS_2763 [Nonlabens marinus S1-08]